SAETFVQLLIDRAKVIADEARQQIPSAPTSAEDPDTELEFVRGLVTGAEDVWKISLQNLSAKLEDIRKTINGVKDEWLPNFNVVNAVYTEALKTKSQKRLLLTKRRRLEARERQCEQKVSAVQEVANQHTGLNAA